MPTWKFTTKRITQSRLYSNLMRKTLSFQPIKIKLSVEHTSYDL